MTVEQLIEILQKVEDKSRKVIFLEADQIASKPEDYHTVRDISTTNADPRVRIYFWA